MDFKHLRNLQESIDGMKKIFAISWSPNLLRLAVAHVDERRSVRITLYEENGNKKEMFQTKAANKNSKSYVVKDIAFSPDSTKLAVSQSDCIIFVYNLGHNWGDKKTICNKFEQNRPVTSMVWPNKKQNEIYFGTADGKVKVGILKTNSASALYATDSYVLSLSYNQDNTTLISIHMDLSVYLYKFETNTSTKICNLPSIAYCLSFLQDNSFMIATLEKKIYIYTTPSAEIAQIFDYSREDKLKDFTICKINSNYDLIAVGNYNKLFIFGYNVKHKQWEQTCILEIDNYYSFTALCWKQDFGILVTGSLCGALDMFESCVKKSVIADKYEITYISLVQVIIKDVEKNKRMTIKTNLSNEITHVNIQSNNFIVATTERSVIVGEISTQKWSEVQWNFTGNEKYDFNNSGVCLVYVNGEIAVIEFGNNDIVGYCRTDYSHPNLVSAKITTNNKVTQRLIAFLIDPTTIYVQDFDKQIAVLNFVNDCNVDYIEFNRSGNRLIFRDSNKNLNMLLVHNGKKTTLLSLCTFMQWVPNTDVLVAQSGRKLYVWYDVETFQNPKTILINGNVEDVQKNRGKYEVYINYDITTTTTNINFNNSSSNSFSPDNTNTNTNNTGLTRIFLDENLINISSAIEERELHKALTILETVTPSNETIIYWKALAKRAIEARNLYIAQRSEASLGDYSKVAYIKRIIKEKEKNAENPLVEAKILILEKRFREAEELLVKHSMINEIIELYKESLKYEDAIRLTKEFKVDEYETMKNDYLKWLIQNEAYDKAADMKIKDNQLIEAIKLLIEGDLPVKAAELIMSRKMDVEKNTLDYLINVIKGIGLIDKANELAVYASQHLN